MKCPFCGHFLENSLSKALNGIQTSEGIVLTNIDYVLEVGRDIAAIFEEKRTKRHIIPLHQLITLKKVAKAVGCELFVLFVHDEDEDVVVYKPPLNIQYPAKKYFNFENSTPIFVGDYIKLRDFILQKIIYRVGMPYKGCRSWRLQK